MQNNKGDIVTLEQFEGKLLVLFLEYILSCLLRRITTL